ncbi:MAG: DUF1540 domain-containing protein [Ruminococcaceae bacterium]|nr:DUF1540 domain-containing protein [Oscillospiraceae bacterium]
MKSNNKISCEAENCLYHKGKTTCTAEEIKVGCHSACCCDDTRCSSFKIREPVTRNYVTPT